MSRKIFFVVLFLLALVITIGAIYFLNLGKLTQPQDSNSSKRVSEEEKSNLNNENIISPKNTSDISSESTPVPRFVVDENTPADYSDVDLINLEKELNTLDLSSENDIE